MRIKILFSEGLFKDQISEMTIPNLHFQLSVHIYEKRPIKLMYFNFPKNYLGRRTLEMMGPIGQSIIVIIVVIVVEHFNKQA